MKVAIWTNMPNHYQSSFHQGLRAGGVDLEVRYYYPVVPDDRLALGWSKGRKLAKGDEWIGPDFELDRCLPDWQERLHVIPGYGDPVLWSLYRTLIDRGIPWAHWSEPSRPGLRRLASWVVKRKYARCVNESALGAFGIGRAALKDFHRWGIREEKLALLPYSAPQYDRASEPDEDCARFAAGRCAFLFLGSLIRRKGVDVLLKAFSRIGDGSEAALLLVGHDSSNGEYRRLAERLGIADRLLFRGPIAPAQLGSAIAAAHVVVLPSRFDGWGVALNEAALMGRGLIASDRVGAAEHLIEPGENGFRVRAGDVKSLANALRTYARDVDLTRRHGQRSLEIAADFTPQRNVERFLTAVQKWQASRNGRHFEVATTSGGVAGNIRSAS